MRLYIMFIGDFEKAAAWSDNAVKGCKRFLDRVWNLAENLTEEAGYSKANESAVHKTIKKVSDDIEAMKFNTAIAALMALVNDFYQNGCSKGDYAALLLMLSPFAPHMVEELWETLGFAAEKGGMACAQPWPAYDASKTMDAEVNMAVQVCGKLRAHHHRPCGQRGGGRGGRRPGRSRRCKSSPRARSWSRPFWYPTSWST